MSQNITISLKGLDIFNGTPSIEIAPLTILTGLNNSGKTTILNAIEKQCNNVKRWKWTGMELLTNGIESEADDVLLFEQPEAGLHPKMQLHIADLLLKQVLSGRTVVVETHSDHFLDRIIRRYMENEEIRTIIKVYFLDKSNSVCSKIMPIVIDEVEGAICENHDFFYQLSDETAMIIDAGYNNLLKQQSK